MMRSLYSGVAGLKNHQTRMDVTGNNIANVNTVGYKAGRTTFQDMLSQSVKGAAAPTGTTGGVNPLQVGLGMGVASVDNIFTTGSMQTTGKNTDLAIDGDGFFMVKSGNETYYTRAGNFDFDSLGNYVIPGTGLQVMGWLADASGNIDTSGETTPIAIALNTAMPPKVTTLIDLTGNLSSSDAVGAKKSTDIAVYDSMGIEHQATMDFTKIDDYTWSVEFDVEGTTGGPYTGTVVFDQNGDYLYDTFTGTGTTTATGTETTTTAGLTGTTVTTTDTTTIPGVTITTDVTYNSVTDIYVDPAGSEYTAAGGPPPTSYTDKDGNVYTFVGAQWEVSTSTTITAGTPLPGGTPGAAPTLDHYIYDTTTTVTTTGTTSCVFTPDSGAAAMTITPNVKDLTQYGIATDAQANDQDGYTAGTLKQASLSVDASGIISGTFSNNKVLNLGQVALANFTNPGGLTKIGTSLFSKSNNSGVPQVGVPGGGGNGKVVSGTLEMSNVDLSEEFTTMITTQRGFQANSRIITTSDTMLEELVNLKR